MTTIDEFLFGVLQPAKLLHLKPLSLKGMERVNGKDESPKYFDPKKGLYFRVPKVQEVALQLASRLYALREIPVLAKFRGVWVVQHDREEKKTAHDDDEDQLAIGMSAFGNRSMGEDDLQAFYFLGRNIALLHQQPLPKGFAFTYPESIDRAVHEWIRYVANDYRSPEGKRIIGSRSVATFREIWGSLSGHEFAYAWDFADCRPSNARVKEKGGVIKELRFTDTESAKPTLKFRSLNYLFQVWGNEEGITQEQFNEFRSGYASQGCSLDDLANGKLVHQEAAITFLLLLGRLKETMHEYEKAKDDSEREILYAFLRPLKSRLLHFSMEGDHYVRSRRYQF